MSVSGQVVNGPFRRGKMLCHSDFVFKVIQCPSFPSFNEALNQQTPEIVTHYLYFKHYPMGGFWFAGAKTLDDLPSEPYMTILLMPHVEYRMEALWPNELP